MSEIQAGFRPDRGCIERTFTVQQILEHRHNFRDPTIYVFPDLKVLFYSADHAIPYRFLAIRCVPEKFISFL